MSSLRTTCWMVLLILVCLCITEHASEADLITIDFSEHGGGRTLDPNFFVDRGILFPPNGFVGFVQGDDALI